ncbi:hypothetical protein NKR23_g4331 [Pleurostoma richardsiae]|uniref:Uncharacterized protein n=1 Tax=Pleurostoma richardsiae TaxID=41990 RepID=A0AA38VS07_9PEZI|nr:hypothetical protein NKR23_g4331 [Pleurostoma richardsiae]
MWGRHITSWKRLELAAGYIALEERDIVSSMLPFFQLLDIRNDVSTADDVMLEKLMYLSNGSVASNPLDHVYGLLGLASCSLSRTIVPNYKLSVQELFKTTTKLFLNESFDCLSMVADPLWRRMSGLPSWVPDWSAPSPAMLLIATWGTPPNAGGNSERKWDVSLDGNRLTVRGLLFDKVTIVGKTFVTPRRLPSRQHNRIGTAIKSIAVNFFGVPPDKKGPRRIRKFWQWERMTEKLSTYPTGDSLAEAFVQTLVAGQEVPSVTDYESRVNLQQLYRRLFTYWFLDGLEHRSRTDPAIEEGMMQYIDRLEMCDYRKIYITEKVYIGLASWSTAPGDDVALVSGAATPYVLRSVRESRRTFQLVGETYVYGLMNGEGFGSKSELQDIILV